MLGALVLTDRKGRRFAIATVAVFALSSALVNVAHALSDRIEEAPVPLLVAYGLTATVALFLSAETASRVVASLAPAIEGETVPKVEGDTGKGKRRKGKSPALPPRRSEDVVIEQAREVARTYARSGRRLTASALQSELRLSWERAVRVLAAVEGAAA